MKFHLDFKPRAAMQSIYHSDGILFIGSCFSEHIGKRMADLKFQIHSNPFGIVFNPHSILSSLTRIISKCYFNESEVFEKEGMWYTLDGHSSIVAKSREELLMQLNSIIDTWNQKLSTTKFLAITFGSAYAYRYKSNKKIVANCHKLPAGLFEKELLEAKDITSNYHKLLKQLRELNPQLSIIFTISPVKHLKDGVVENSLSKAILIQSVHQIVNTNSNCNYFPAYELVNDDLRDYRFYEADMAHPNKLAIDYVWGNFSNSYFNDETKLLNKKIDEINQALQHRPFNPDTESHLKFKNNFREKCQTLNENYPGIDLENELNYFSK